MQKRKFKVNVLDVTIIIVVICAFAALFFHDTLGDIFGRPEIVELEVTVTADNSDPNAATMLATGNVVTFESVSSGNSLHAVVTSVKTEDNTVKAVLKINGYEKLGRLYTQNGDVLGEGTDYACYLGEGRLPCKVSFAGILG